MKKLFAVLLAIAMMLCAFTGCGKEAEQEAAPEEPTTGLPNPMVETDASGLTDAFGVTFTVPEGAENPVYYIINNEIGELQFTIDSTAYTARLKPTADFEDISGAYYEWTADEADDTLSNFVGEIRVYISDSEEDVMNYLWYDGYSGVMYSLVASCNDVNGLDPTVYAVELMGDNYIDYNKDYTGTYEDLDFDTVEMTRSEDGSYAIVIGITRLCQIEAEGYNMDGAVEFSGLDPAGEEITGIFYPADETYTLLFTTSTWEYLEAGTSFEGFVLK